MKRDGLIGAALITLCFSAYVCGRGYQSSVSPRVGVLASPTPATTPNPPADFGNVVYRDLANISFTDLYETVRQARAQNRVQWLHELEEAPESPRKIGALCGFFRALVQADPKMAADLVINLPRHRGPAMDAMISAAPPSAMPVLAEMLLKVPEAGRNYQLTDHLAVVIDEWAQVDPEAAAQFLDRHTDSQELPIQQYADALVGTWAGIDHESAWTWFESHSDDLSGFCVESWLNGWFEADQDGAIKFALEHLDDRKFAEASTSFAPHLFQQDPNTAKRFIEKLAIAELRKQALSGISSEAGSPDYLEDYQPDVVSKFIVQFPLDEWPDRFSDVINRWRFRDIPGLLNWISTLPQDAQAKVIENFPEPISYEREAELLPVLQRPESELRTKLLRQLVLGMQSDVERFENRTAREAIEKLQLSAEQKAELASFLPKKDNP
jgi:hypothetical protein